jgi:hypothetical protein
LLFDTGDDRVVGNGAYMIDTHFLWEDMGSYFLHKKMLLASVDMKMALKV